MKVYLSNYRDYWYSPYTWIDYAFFWTDWSKCSRNRGLDMAIAEIEGKYKYIEHHEWVDKLSDYLTPISRGIQWVLGKIHPRINYVKIDYWDTWSMDHTLAHIVLPMLKQLKATKHGSALVDPEDVPEELRMTGYDDGSSQFILQFEDDEQFQKESWDITHRRWEWVLNEMIFAFEHLLDDSWEENFRSGHIDMKSVPCEWDENGKPKLYTFEDGPNHTYECDYDGMKKVYDRIDNGFRLFGKYYRGLWD